METNNLITDNTHIPERVGRVINPYRQRPSFNSLTSNISALAEDIRGRQTDNVACCETSSLTECIHAASSEFIPLFLKGCCVKILLELISKRNLKHLRG